MYVYFFVIFVGIFWILLYVHKIAHWVNVVRLHYDMKNKSHLYTKPLSKPRTLKRKYTLSLTTSPIRLAHDISAVFEPFSMSQVHRILVNLPKHFHNDPTQIQDPQHIADLQKKFPKVEIVWHELDSGPDMKFLGSLDVTDSDEYIVVLDDDTLQKNSLLEDYENVQDSVEENVNYVATASPEVIFGIRIQPGFASWCVRRSLIDSRSFRNINQTQKDCSRQCSKHDDFSLGSTFQDLCFLRLKTATGKPMQLDLGWNSDALHIQHPSIVKHYECSNAIWQKRQMCPQWEESFWHHNWLLRGLSKVSQNYLTFLGSRYTFKSD